MSASTDHSDDLRQVLSDGEEVVWHGEPDRRSLVVGYLVGMVPLLLFLGPMVFIPTMFAVMMVGVAIEAGIAYLLVGFLFAAGFTLVVVFGGGYLLANRAFDFAEYAVTDQRLIEFGGFVGRDYSTVDWDNVEDFEVNVGFVDDRYGTGSISAITAGSGGVSFSSIPDPYGVLDTFESIRRGESR